MSWMISGVRVPSEVTDDEAEVSLPFSRLMWLKAKEVEDVPIEAVVVDLKQHKIKFNKYFFKSIWNRLTLREVEETNRLLLFLT